MLEYRRWKAAVSIIEFAAELGWHFDDPIYREWESRLVAQDKRILVLAPRGSRKSTFYSMIYPAWRLLHDPNLRIALGSLKEGKSKQWIQQIVNVYLSNPNVVELYGEYIRKNHNNRFEKTLSSNWNTIKRFDYMHEGYNLAAFGFDSSIQGNHADLIIIDDPCNHDDSLSQTVRENRIIIFQQNLGTIAKDTQIIVIGTPKHHEDLYAHIEHVVNPRLPDADKWKIVRDTPYKDDGSLRFPDAVSQKAIDTFIAEMGKYVADHEIHLKVYPRGDTIFNPADMHTYDYDELIIGLTKPSNDPIIEQKRRERLSKCRLGLYLDPAKSEKGDSNAIAVAMKVSEGYTQEGKEVFKVFLLEGILLKGLKDLMSIIKRLLTKYMEIGLRIESVWVEENAFQEVLKDNIKEEIAKSGYLTFVLGVQNRINKNTRITLCEIPYVTGVLRIATDWQDRYNDFIQEVLGYPTMKHDDAPDALAGVVEELTRLLSSNLKVF